MWQCWHSRQLFLARPSNSLPMLFYDIIKVVSITSSKLSRTFTLLPHRSFLVFSRKMVWTEVVPNEPEVKPGKFCCLHSFFFVFRLALDCTCFALSQFSLYLFLLNFVLFLFGMIFYFHNFTKQFICMTCFFLLFSPHFHSLFYFYFCGLCIFLGLAIAFCMTCIRPTEFVWYTFVKF